MLSLDFNTRNSGSLAARLNKTVKVVAKLEQTQAKIAEFGVWNDIYTDWANYELDQADLAQTLAGIKYHTEQAQFWAGLVVNVGKTSTGQRVVATNPNPHTTGYTIKLPNGTLVSGSAQLVFAKWQESHGKKPYSVNLPKYIESKAGAEFKAAIVRNSR